MSKSLQNKIAIIFLVLCFPIGILLMFFWKLFTPWVRFFVATSLILVSLTVGISFWQIQKITANLEAQVNKELTAVASSPAAMSKSGFNPPNQELFQKPTETSWTPITANGVEITILDFTGQTYSNKIGKKTLNYCAVSFSIKNLLTENINIAPDNMFMLSPEGTDLNFPLTGITGLGGFETKPSQAYFGEEKFDLAPGTTKEGFLAFDCPDFKTSYVFQSDVNQFYPEVISQELPYRPLKIKLSLSNKNA